MTGGQWSKVLLVLLRLVLPFVAFLLKDGPSLKVFWAFLLQLCEHIRGSFMASTKSFGTSAPALDVDSFRRDPLGRVVTSELRAGVLLDVDGTLVDTNYLHTLAWSRALSDAGEWAPMNAIHRLVGMGGDRLVPELLGHESPAAVEARPRHYRQLIDEARPFPGAGAFLRHLHSQGLAVVLATSAPDDELDRLLAGFDARDVVDAKTTADDVTATKPAPDVFYAAMKAGKIDPKRAVAVGDSIWDVQAARSAGVACIAVETGGFSLHELSEAGAIQVYRDVREVLDQYITGPLHNLVAQ
jgi:HAD superfamily hydrolase (TIGR01509 family)